MKKIVVTGGLGFIGSNLINLLHKRGFFVINLDKKQFYSSDFNIINKKKHNYKFFKVDINQRNKVLRILMKYKPIGIFNLAAETHVDRSIDDASNFIKSNLFGVFNLLEAIKSYQSKVKKNIRLLHISTDEVYGDILGGRRSNENFPYKPSSPYSATKAGGDHLINAYCRTYGLNITISNCCNNYGPGQYPEKLIPKLIFCIKNNKPLEIYGKGKNSREWIYVDDHCEALLKVFNRGKKGESYNIGTNFNLSNLNLAKKILKIIKMKNILINKKSIIKFVKDRPGHDYRYALDSKKIRKKLKWVPKTNFNKGILLTINWYLKNKKFSSSFSKKIDLRRIGLLK